MQITPGAEIQNLDVFSDNLSFTCALRMSGLRKKGGGVGGQNPFTVKPGDVRPRVMHIGTPPLVGTGLL